MSKFWPYVLYTQIIMWQLLETLRNNWYMPFVSLLLWSFLDPAAWNRDAATLVHEVMATAWGMACGEHEEARAPEDFVEQNCTIIPALLTPDSIYLKKKINIYLTEATVILEFL